MTSSDGVPVDPVQRLRALDTCAVSDALDHLSLAGAVIGIRPVWPFTGVVAGRARRVRAAPRPASGPAAHIASALVDIAEPDDVIVIDNRGRTDVSCWGGLLAEAAVQRRVAGVVVDGAVRDVADCESARLAVFARTVVPITARGRIVQDDMDVQVQIGLLCVSPGDFVIADRNGVVFIAAAVIEQVIGLAESVTERERVMAEQVRAGRSVVEVMHDAQFALRAPGGPSRDS